MSDSSSDRSDSDADPEEVSELSTSGSDEDSDAQEGATFGDRIKQSQEGHLQRGHFNGVLGGGAKQQSHRKFEKQKIKASEGMPTAKFKRENKNRPAEQSSQRPVPRFRDIIETSHRQSVDPRFDDLTGTFRDETFKKRYAFLFDEQLPQEKSQLRKQMKSAKSLNRKQELQADLTRIEQQIRAETEQRKRQAAEKAIKAKEKEAVKAGKKPYFLKKSEKKKQELIRKYQDLKASGGLEKAMAKRRRKNAAKDHRFVPSTTR